MDEAAPREILLVLETAGTPEVQLHAGGGSIEVELNPVQSFRHHRAAAVVVGAIPAVSDGWLVVGGRRSPLEPEAGVVEITFTEQGWEEGLVAMDPMPVLPFEDTVWQVPALGWGSWLGLVLLLAVAVWRAR